MPNADNLRKAAQALTAGHLVGLPTETVYGLAGDARNAAAIEKIYATKGRPAFNPLIIHLANAVAAENYGVFNDSARALAAVFWPGPLTLVVPAKAGNDIAAAALANLPTIALRVPAHAVAQDLLKIFNGPLAAPSANPSGQLSPTQATHVMNGFAASAEPKYVLAGGRSSHGLESTIVDCTTDIPHILRLGAITAEQLAGVVALRDIGDTVDLSLDGKLEAGDDIIIAPGQLLRHYAPRKPLRLNAENAEADEALLIFGPPPLWAKRTAIVMNLSAQGDLHEAASNLFSMLHELDHSPARVIAVVAIPNEGLGLAINDRLQRGANI